MNWGWGKGSSDGTNVKLAEPDSESGSCLATSTLRFSAQQQSSLVSSLDSDK